MQTITYYEQREHERHLRQEMIEMAGRLHALGFAPASDGNLSCRLEENRILITPSNCSLAYLKAKQLLVVNLAGETQSVSHNGQRSRRPSAEMPMHLEVYRQRPDINAVIHAHPPMALACMLADISLGTAAIPEMIYHLGSIPTAPYATIGTPEAAQSVRYLVKEHDAILLDRRGTLTLGQSLEEAMMHVERIEHTAKAMLAATNVIKQAVAELPIEEVDKLEVMRRRNLINQGRIRHTHHANLHAPFIFNYREHDY